MAKTIAAHKLNAVERAVASYPDGVGVQGILDTLGDDTPRRTVQYWLNFLVKEGRVIKTGDRRWARYTVPTTYAETMAVNRDSNALPEGSNTTQTASSNGDASSDAYSLGSNEQSPLSTNNAPPFSASALETQHYLDQPVQTRAPVRYVRAFLDGYGASATYLTDTERRHLWEIGRTWAADEPPGTYTKQILDDFLLDLAWNSSRLEGNAYSLHDARRLIHFGTFAESAGPLDVQMILNHRDAIEFIVDCADHAGFNRHTICNLHALLANDLLGDPAAPGRLRRMKVGIGNSAYSPLDVPQLIEECFDQILAKAAAINDPFEQALFAMAQLPYLQPFDDVNKRVSRLAANIPLVNANLVPLSFTELEADIYTSGMLGVYELNRIDLLKEVFIWAYERSVSLHGTVKSTEFEPDGFHLKHRYNLREVVRTIVQECLSRKDAFARIADWAWANIDVEDQDQFLEVAELELLSLHEGNIAPYRINLAQFRAWREVWGERA